MKSWCLTLMLVILTAAAYHWQKPCRSWLLNAESAVSTTDIQEEASRLLFCRGSVVDANKEASHKLRLQKILRDQRLADKMFYADVTAAVDQEMHSWRRQWEKDEERQQRLNWQRIDETGMEGAIRESLLDQSWIEKQIASVVQITETELAAGLVSQQEHLQIPAAYHVAHLFLSGHQPNQKDRIRKISSIRLRLDDGEKWAALVQQYSEDPRTKNQGGDLGWLAESRTPPKFMTVVCNMKPGDISMPIRTPLGWHIVRLLEKQPNQSGRLKDVRTELTASFADQKRAEAITQLLQRLLHGQPGPSL